MREIKVSRKEGRKRDETAFPMRRMHPSRKEPCNPYLRPVRHSRCSEYQQYRSHISTGLHRQTTHTHPHTCLGLRITYSADLLRRVVPQQKARRLAGWLAESRGTGDTTKLARTEDETRLQAIHHISRASQIP